METKGFFQFYNVLVSSFRFIWIPILCVFVHCKYVTLSMLGIDLRRQNLTSIDVRFRRIKSVTAMNGLKRCNAAAQGQTTITAYFSSEQLLLFAFERHRSGKCKRGGCATTDELTSQSEWLSSILTRSRRWPLASAGRRRLPLNAAITDKINENLINPGNVSG